MFPDKKLEDHVFFVNHKSPKFVALNTWFVGKLTSHIVLLCVYIITVLACVENHCACLSFAEAGFTQTEFQHNR